MDGPYELRAYSWEPKMNESTNLKQNQKPKNEMMTTNRNIRNRQQEKCKSHPRPTRKMRNYLTSLHVVRKLKKYQELGVVRENMEKKLKRHQKVVDRYREEQAQRPRKKGAKKSAAISNEALKKKSLITENRDRQVKRENYPAEEVIKDDPLCLAIVSRGRGYDEPIRTQWSGIQSDLMELVSAYKLYNPDSPKPRYDFRDTHRGFRIIKCMNEFSKQFIYNYFNKICDKWSHLNLAIIPASEIPKSSKTEPLANSSDTTTTGLLSRRPFTEVITDPLCLALAAEQNNYDIPVRYEWPSIQSDLLEHINAYNLLNPNDPIPPYDTAEIHRGFRIIKCKNEFAKEFLYNCIEKIFEKWRNVKLKLLPASQLPKKQKKPIAINKLKMEKTMTDYIAEENAIKPSDQPGHGKESETQRRTDLAGKSPPTTSSNNFLQNNKDFATNPFGTTGFQLNETYDTAPEKRSNSYGRRMNIAENYIRNSNLQQDYPKFSDNYNDRRSRDIQFNERSSRERNQMYAEGWQDSYERLNSNLQKTYQNSQQNYANIDTNPRFSSNSGQQNFNTFNDFSSADNLNYNQFSHGPSEDFARNYQPAYDDATFSMNSSSQNFRDLPLSSHPEYYSSRQHSSNFLPNDELPPPPPSFENFTDCDYRMERSRRLRSRSRSRSVDRYRRSRSGNNNRRSPNRNGNRRSNQSRNRNRRNY